LGLIWQQQQQQQQPGVRAQVFKRDAFNRFRERSFR